MKSLISNTERKILGEFERKLRNETVIKDYMEDKIAELKEEIVNVCLCRQWTRKECSPKKASLSEKSSSPSNQFFPSSKTPRKNSHKSSTKRKKYLPTTSKVLSL